MSGGLPTAVDPILLAEQGARLSGRLAVRDLGRLRAQLADDTGEIEVELVFERAQGSNLRRMHGRVTGMLTLRCERCLEPMMIDVVAEPDAILLREDEAERGLPPEADTLTVGHTPMAVADLIEDELLLALPMVPMHRLAECPARDYVGSGKTGDASKRSPLAELARAKRELK